jgi:hypothetical protein
MFCPYRIYRPPVMATVAGAFEDRTLPFEPMVVMTPMQIVTIRASRIAYSTAVGPSSRLMNSIAARVSLRTAPPPQFDVLCIRRWPPGVVLLLSSSDHPGLN